MTDAEVKALKVGDRVRTFPCVCGTPHEANVIEIMKRGAGQSYLTTGHWWVCVVLSEMIPPTKASFMIESDEYLKSCNVPTHSVTGQRIRGADLVTEYRAPAAPGFAGFPGPWGGFRP